MGLDNWVHLPANILESGRTTHYVDPSLGEEERETLLAELEEKEAIVERLRSITEDKPYEYNGYSAPNNWTAKLCGETIPVSQVGRLEGQSLIYGTALLTNLSWPGSATVAYQGGWVNIYIGYGHRATQELSIIKQLADLELEGEDKNGFPEPNPSKPPAPPAPEEGAEG